MKLIRQETPTYPLSIFHKNHSIQFQLSEFIEQPQISKNLKQNENLQQQQSIDIRNFKQPQRMGLLSDLGQILSPEETAKLQPFLKKLGIQQFLYILKKYKNWQKQTKPSIIKWGEEIQGHFLKFNQNQELQLCLQPLSQEYEGVDFPLVLQYGRWMFEMTPSEPYSTECDFGEIIRTIKKKYEILQSKSRIPLTIPNIPLLGLRSQDSSKPFDNTITQSLYIDDTHISNHLRFRTLTKNIRVRRGQKVSIKVPIYHDVNTSLEQLSKTEPDPNFIYMDAMAFGMGISCLQCTFSTKNLDHARYVYDQMHVISPLMLAVTAGTPFYKGKVSDWDVRWKVIEGSVDCRNAQQRNPNSPSYLPSSRYSQANLFIWPGPLNNPSYNNLPLNIPSQIKSYISQKSLENNTQIDPYLLQHIANIFKRDVLIAHQKFKTMTQESYTIFQMLNGTNWNSVRLKIPIDDQIGWRVEFRTMEVQLTAEENAAFSLFIHFFTRVLHEDNVKINLYLPMSYVKENFQRAHVKDAVRTQKFYFRTNIFQSGAPVIEQLTLHQIFFGKNQFPGIVTYTIDTLLSYKLSQSCKLKCPTFTKIVKQVKQFLYSITSGKRLTLAQWMRQYIGKHQGYKKNSILEKHVIDDLLIRLDAICRGKVSDPNFGKIFMEEEDEVCCEKEKICKGKGKVEKGEKVEKIEKEQKQVKKEVKEGTVGKHKYVQKKQHKLCENRLSSSQDNQLGKTHQKCSQQFFTRKQSQIKEYLDEELIKTVWK